MAKKVVGKDKWKLKRKYRVILPQENFGSKEMALIVSSNPENLINRRITFSIRDINQDKQKQHINVTFRIHKVEGDKALTKFDELNIDRKYLLSRIVPGHTVIDQPFIVKLKDAEIKLAVNVLTAYKIHASQRRDMIKRIPVVLDSYKNESIYNFLDFVISGRINAEIFKNLKKIVPIRRVEIRKINILKSIPITETTKTPAAEAPVTQTPSTEIPKPPVTETTPTTPVQENLPSGTQLPQPDSQQPPQQPT